LLSAAGQIVDVHIPTDRDTGRPRGFAFVEFSTEAEAQEAIRLFDGKELGDRQLRINIAEDRPPRSNEGRSFGPRGGGGGGGGGGRGGGGGGGGGGKPFKSKGSRRGLRARKRSL
jgi:RNA recognition motif-containing protein